jgi:hypothetical protein
MNRINIFQVPRYAATNCVQLQNQRLMDCFAALANASSTESMTDSLEIAYTRATNHRHCEERSDEAIHEIAYKRATNHRHCEERSDEAIHEIAYKRATNHRHWLRRTCVCEERSDEVIP